ncbi:di-heme oxidoredictase family protein [soil metagenome]
MEPVDAGPDRFKPAGDPSDIPINGIGRDLAAQFGEGDALFDLPYRAPDGLGPLFIRAACGDCHSGAARGPGLVQKMAVVLPDEVTPDPDQSKLPFGNTLRLQLAAGATTPVDAPKDPAVRVTIRVGPPVLGRGYMEAITDAEILRMEAEQKTRTDGIHGHVNHVVFASTTSGNPAYYGYKQGDVVIGRFGLKARIATLDDFAADAFSGDMGLTSPMRPVEHENPDHLTDDLRPGIDVSVASIDKLAMYMRLLAIPYRETPSAVGEAAFTAAKCNVCHAPSLKTRADYPIKVLAGIDAPVFTDLLVHDMGDAFGDGVVDGEAQSREWRTAPLMGIRFARTYLHDSRAVSLDDAIRLHGGEAKVSVDLYTALPEKDRTALLDYVGSL